MYKKILKKLSVLFVMTVLLSSVFSIAFVQAGAVNKGWNFLVTGYAVEDEPVDSGGVAVDVSLYSGSAGMTPDSPFYFMDTLFDGLQSPESLTQEKLGEMGVMISEGSYSDAGVAARYYGEYAVEVHADVLSLEDQGEFLEDEYTIYRHDAYVDELKMDLVEAVESGALSAELAAETGIDTVQEDVVGLKQDLVDTREGYIETVAAQEGISLIEADLVLQESESAAGVGAYQEEELAEGLPVAGEAFVEIEEDLHALLDSSEVTPEQEQVIEELLDEVELHLEEAAGSYEDGFIADAQGELADAEVLLLFCGQMLDYGINSVPVEKIQKIVEEEQTEREEDIEIEYVEYEEHLDELLVEYPERAEEIQHQAEQMQRVHDLNTLYQEQYGDSYQELLDEGNTDAEVAAILGNRWDQLYLEIYGEPYAPPGFYGDEVVDDEGIEVIPIGIIDPQQEQANDLTAELSIELGTLWSDLVADGMSEQEASMEIGRVWDERYLEVYGEPYQPVQDEYIDESVIGVDDGSVIFLDEVERGGFVTDHEYYDPATGNTYTFNEEGYTYEDFLGQEHEIVYDESFVPSEEVQGFEDGTETYEYTSDADGEELTYEYTATGYTIVDEEGEEVATEAYPEGTYETVGGNAEIEIDTFGFEIDPADGDPIIYEYSPEFQNYVSIDGHVYVPPGRVSYHYDAIEYSDGVYGYTYGSEAWKYDPSSGVWISTGGEVYTPYVTSVAPTGYEDYGRYESESGKVWNYDGITGEWRSDSGDKWTYYTDEGTWKNTDTGVAYNPSLTYQTYYYGYVDSSERGNYDSHTVNGVTWSFDEETNAWTSTDGEVYYTPDYSTYDIGYRSAEETGGDTSGYSYGYYGYHTDYSAVEDSGSVYTWNYNSETGGWESSGGYTYYTPISTNYYSPEYSSGSSSSSGESWSYDSTSGQWISSAGEAYTPTSYTYYSGSYTGGGGYDASGNYVGGEYGGYDYSGNYIGGEDYTYDSVTGTYTYTGDDGISYSTYSGGYAYSGYSYAPSYTSTGTSDGYYSYSPESGSYTYTYSDSTSGTHTGDSSSYSSSSYSAPSSSDSSSSSSGGDSGSYSAPTGYFSLNLYRSF